MPELTEEYLKELLPRLEALTQSGNICTVKTDNGSILLSEIWHYPDRKKTDPDNEYEIYPFAKLLTDEETAEFKLEGEIPEQ